MSDDLSQIITWSTASGTLVIDYLDVKRQIDATSRRDLDVVELWSGVGRVAAVARERGHEAAEFDVDRIPGLTNTPGACNEDKFISKRPCSTGGWSGGKGMWVTCCFSLSPLTPLIFH
jgi:hypothetical protein